MSNTKKPLTFIDLIDETGRTSSLSIHGNGNNNNGKLGGNTLGVIGGLPHNLAFQPATKADARKLIKWLTDNMDSFPVNKCVYYKSVH